MAFHGSAELTTAWSVDSGVLSRADDREMKNIIVFLYIALLLLLLNYWKSSLFYIYSTLLCTLIYSSPVWTPEYVRVFLFLLVNRGDEEDSMLELG